MISIEVAPSIPAHVTEPLEILLPADTDATRPAPATARSERGAIIALLIACLAWGGSFTWAAAIIAKTNRIFGVAATDSLGVLLLQSWRFSLAGIVWLAVFPGARSGWSWASLGRAALLSAPFTAGMIVQQMGLARTSPAVNAFLTGLNVLFVPLITVFVKRRLPHPSLWIGIGMAMIGTWLLAGGGPRGVGAGELLGLTCSVLFSIHILLINALLSRDTPARMVGGQFILTGIASFIITLAIEPSSRSAQRLLVLPLSQELWLDLAMLILLSTLLAFGLMLFFQPRVDPTRAAFVYLTEPVFAAGYAWLAAGIAVPPAGIAGAALIIAANSLVEWLAARRRALQTALAS